MSSVLFVPFPVLTTDRLTLRKLGLSNADGIFALRSDPAVIRYTGIKQYITISQAEDYIKKIDRDLENGQSIMWSISLTASSQFVGSICIWNITEDGRCAEIGYDLLPAFHGKGFMQEAVKAVIEYGFHGMKLDKIVADLRTENIQSVMLLERSGFIRGTVHEIPIEGNVKAEMAVYYLERAAFEENLNR